MKGKGQSSYTVQIKAGFPPVRQQTSYPKKMAHGQLLRIGEKISHGEYVEIPEGSQGKLSKAIEARGLKVVRRECEDRTMMAIYAVTPEWLAENPERS